MMRLASTSRRILSSTCKNNSIFASCSHNSVQKFHTNLSRMDSATSEDDVPVLSGRTFNEDQTTERILNKLKQYSNLTDDAPVDVELEEVQRLAQEEGNKRIYRREYDLLWEDEREPQYFRNSVQGKKIADIPCIFDMVPQLADRISPVITKAELEELLKKPKDVYNYIVVDVRSAYRALDYVIPGASNIPFTEIKEGVFGLKAEVFNKRYQEMLPDAYTNIICYSDSPAESEAACMMLQDMGFHNTINYRGGCSEWFGNEFKILWRKKKLHKISGERKQRMIQIKEKSKEKLNNPSPKE